MTVAADKIRDLERYCRDLVSERDRLTAEVARLTEALTEIRWRLSDFTANSGMSDCEDALQIAREALARAALPKEPT